MAVPVPDNSAQDYSDVPVYYEPFSYAKEMTRWIYTALPIG